MKYQSLFLAVTCCLLRSAPSTAADFFTLTPCRALDTRQTGLPASPAGPLSLSMNSCGVPPDASAVVGNLTVVAPDSAGYVQLAPGAYITSNSTLNFDAGHTKTNNFATALGVAGTVDIYGSTVVDVIVDVTGYYKEAVLCLANNNRCVPRSHFTYTASDYPFTEDISFSNATTNSLPYHDPIPVAQNAGFVTLQTGCDLIHQRNVNAAQFVNLMLHAMVSIMGDELGLVTTAQPGARFEVQLLLDGHVAGWFLRRVKAGLPQNEYFETTLQNTSAGAHTFTVAVRLLDSGVIVMGQTWITAIGAPATSNPSGASVLAAGATLTQSFQPISDTLTFVAPSSGLDLFANGYMQVDSGTPGQLIELQFELDGSPWHVSRIAVPDSLSSGINFVDHKLSVPAGSHSLRWSARTLAGAVSASHRDVEFFSVAAQTAPNTRFAVAEQTSSAPCGDPSNTTCRVSTSYTGDVPPPTALDTVCGPWTKLLSVVMPQSLPTGTNVFMDGYVEVLASNLASNRPVQLALTQDQQGYEVGTISIGVVNRADGYYFFSDGSSDVSCAGCSVSLWARNILGCNYPGAGPGTFDVGLRYLSVKFTPQDGCRL